MPWDGRGRRPRPSPKNDSYRTVRISVGHHEEVVNGENGHRKPGRPAKRLLDRLIEGSFRPNHHASLLAGEDLPADPPPGWRTEDWEEALDHQEQFRQAAGRGEKQDHAYAIARLAGGERKAGQPTQAQVMAALFGPNIRAGAPGSPERRRYATALTIWLRWRKFDRLAWLVVHNVRLTAQELWKAWAEHEPRDPPEDDTYPHTYGAKEADVDEMEAVLAERWPTAV